MKIKKVLIMALCFVLGALIAVGGTLAYFTDRESKANVFTVGDVEIELNEVYKQGSELLPGVNVQKEASVTNTGKNDAWVWMTMAIPAALDSNDTSTVGTENVLHWNVPGAVWKGYGDNPSWMTAEKIKKALDNGFITNEHLNADGTAVKSECMWTICQKANDPVAIKQETIDNVVYNVYTFLYNGTLAPGATTPVSLHQVCLDAKVDITPDGQWYFVNDGATTKLNWNSNTNGNPIVHVSAYAIQKETFETVEEAYAAYNTQWGDKGTEYAPVISDAAQFAAAGENGGDILLGNDVKLEEVAKITKDANIDLAGNTLTAEKVNGYDDVLTVRADVTLKNGTVKADTGYAIAVGHSGKDITGNLTIESGTYIGQTTAVQVGQGELVIKGGYFEAKPYSGGGDPYGYTINCMDTPYDNGTAKITIIGGTFFNFDPSNNVSEGANTDYVPDGYKVIAEEDGKGNTLYTVVAE